eukprot:c2501_g1_i1.p1 GENE.c2501_g1_i1~~c2501_g1_i1.p1  ORF type:complete len:233 (-),score=55.34 c2501_g1_i1:765-1463(-)
MLLRSTSLQQISRIHLPQTLAVVCQRTYIRPSAVRYEESDDANLPRGDKLARRLQLKIPEFWTKNEDGEPLPSKKVVELVNQFMGLTMFEAADFSDLLKANMRASDDFHHQQLITQYDARRLGFIYGLSGQAGGAGGAAAGGAAPAAEIAEKAEEPKAAPAKTHFELKLESYDQAKKVHVIKEVRAITKLGLKEAKDLVEKAPVVILKDVPAEEAETFMKKLAEVGAQIVKS